MNKKPRDLLERTQLFAEQALQATKHLPSGAETGNLKRQFIRAATSVGANYRAARRSRTKREFISRLGVAEEEADECIYWLNLLMNLEPDQAQNLKPLHQEAGELVAITVDPRRPRNGAKEQHRGNSADNVVIMVDIFQHPAGQLPPGLNASFD